MSEQRRRNSFGIVVLFLATIGMAIVLLPFWVAIFWAVVLGVLFWPLRRKMVSWLHGRTTVASSLIVLVILVFVFIPVFLIAGLIADGAIAVVAQIQSGAIQPGAMFDTLPTRFPKSANFLSSIGFDVGAIRQTLEQSFISVAQFTVTHLAQIGQGASAFAFQLFLALYVLFAILQYGDDIYWSFFDAVPLTRHQKEEFFAAFSKMAVATIKGMVSVGIVQAILGGVIFWLVGIENAPFWGALMGLLSVVPPFGAGFIWGPAGLILVVNGNVTGGLILLAFGVGVISMSDNVVRPIVVGRSTSVPGYLVLVTTLGGLAMFGLTGLVLGPVLASLFLSGWQLFGEGGTQASQLRQPEKSEPEI